MEGVKKFFKIWGLFIKSHFVCIHMLGDLKVDELIERDTSNEDGDDFQHWNCACTCKCGEKVEQKFSFCMYLGDPQTRHKVRK